MPKIIVKIKLKSETSPREFVADTVGAGFGGAFLTFKVEVDPLRRKKKDVMFSLGEIEWLELLEQDET